MLCRCGSPARHHHIIDGVILDTCNRCHVVVQRLAHSLLSIPADVVIGLLTDEELAWVAPEPFDFSTRKVPEAVGASAETLDPQGLMPFLEKHRLVVFPALQDDIALVERMPVMVPLPEDDGYEQSRREH